MLLKFLRGSILPGTAKGFAAEGEVIEVDPADARNLLAEGAAEIAPGAPQYVNPANEQRVIAEHSTAMARQRSLGARGPRQDHPTGLDEDKQKEIALATASHVPADVAFTPEQHEFKPLAPKTDEEIQADEAKKQDEEIHHES